MEQKRRNRAAAALIAGLGLVAGATAADKGELTIRVDGLRSDEGQVLVALTTQAVPANGGVVRADMKKSSAEGVSFVMEGVPDGTYYIQLFHDENGNYDMDMVEGMPQEGFGRYAEDPNHSPGVVIDGENAQARITMVYLTDKK